MLKVGDRIRLREPLGRMALRQKFHCDGSDKTGTLERINNTAMGRDDWRYLIRLDNGKAVNACERDIETLNQNIPVPNYQVGDLIITDMRDVGIIIRSLPDDPSWVHLVRFPSGGEEEVYYDWILKRYTDRGEYEIHTSIRDR